MEDIKKQYTIQWVGPFHSLEEARKHRLGAKNGEFATPDCFNFYFFRGNKKGRGHKHSKFYSYFGIHKALDGYHNRLNSSHSHYREFHENENLDIWIGALGNLEQHSPHVVEEIETIFISMYWDSDFLTENQRKTKRDIRQLKSTICIINLWYDTEEKPLKSKPDSIKLFDDVIACECDEKYPRFLVAKRLKPWAKE